ncbi:helix-turn-helix domain-containing protein [Legionella sp. 16cNR16C]|uniref:helix-turn-helix domain-containing protein n=1 Tax=Legionella sp. 16cNR16C TaxID=2905656 RepID=UPI001E499ED1|nr:helix-turn-helix domain-containing protein [Legionella sp. 16cNR16C]MCE3046382.1 helix-turn-helix domain-containing protein [Legionella sp. 16cNR16C]
MSNLSMEIKIPNTHDRGIARQSFQRVKTIGKRPSKSFLDLDGVKVELPRAAVELVIAILGELAEGHSLTLTPGHAHLTTQEAADLLNVSRPYFVKLLEEGKIPFSRVGNRRRVLASDVMIFKNKTVVEREQALQELTNQAQDLEMGY